MQSTINPKVSVVMSVYNESIDLIKTAINSILNQTFKDFEYIIIVDKPDRKKMISEINDIAKEDKRIRLLINETNLGLPLSLNKGIELSRSPYILRMDADDISLETRIEKQYNFINSSNYDVVSTSYYIMDECGKMIGFDDTVNYNNNIEKLLPHKNIIHHPTTIMRKEILEKVNGYRNIKSAEDYDLWLRMMLVGAKFHKLSDKLFKYRIRMSGISQSNKAYQIATFIYIKKLFIERLETGKDSFSVEKHRDFVENLISGKEEKVAESYAILESNKTQKNTHKLKSYFIRLKIVLTDKVYREYFFQNLKVRRNLRKDV